MNFGIIAAGEGSRLASEGIDTPKPLIKLQGTPMVERLIRIFERNDASGIYIVTNGFMPEVESFLRNLKVKEGVDYNIKIKTTPSSMHTFYELSEMLSGKGRFIVTTVDTIFREEDFSKYVQAYESLGDDYDGMMAVTDFIDDEKPLYVAIDDDFNITGFYDTPVINAKYISGGIYGLGQKAIEVLDDCMKAGVSRMRNYQRALVEKGLRLKAFPMGKIIDVDHAGDIDRALELINN